MQQFMYAYKINPVTKWAHSMTVLAQKYKTLTMMSS